MMGKGKYTMRKGKRNHIRGNRERHEAKRGHMRKKRMHKGKREHRRKNRERLEDKRDPMREKGERSERIKGPYEGKWRI